jgi:hypothetical protein
MYIEDIIDKLVGVSSWLNHGTMTFLQSKDHQLLSSFDSQLSRSSSLTEKQRFLALTILKKYSSDISIFLGNDVGPYLQNPQFKYPARKIATEKTVKITVDDQNKKIIKITFPYEENIVQGIKNYRTQFLKEMYGPTSYQNIDINWNGDTKSWDFLLCENHIKWLDTFLQGHGFEFDDEFKNYFLEIQKIELDMENFVPIVIFEDNKFKFKNSHQNIPQPESTDLLRVLFDAKKYGIYCWDESINEAINDQSIRPFTRKILKETSGQSLPQNGEKIEFSDLENLIEYSNQVIFIIPGGSELDSLKHCHRMLNDLGYTNDQLAVLFRLDSSAGYLCNEYVKNHNLNNLINEKIKIFFISGKVPKPLVSSLPSIDAIINLGSNSAHYTQRNLLKQHHCVIDYSMPRVLKE